MRILTIAILSIILFFVVFIALAKVTGENHYSAIVAAAMMYIGFPMLFLRKWQSEWQGPVVKVCNYVLAFGVLYICGHYLYVAYKGEAEIYQAVKAFGMFGFAALYYIFVGRFPIDLKQKII